MHNDVEYIHININKVYLYINKTHFVSLRTNNDNKNDKKKNK